MNKKSLFLSLLMSINAYACERQADFNYSIVKTDDIFSILIERKDKQPFQYYNIQNPDAVYYGDGRRFLWLEKPIMGYRFVDGRKVELKVEDWHFYPGISAEDKIEKNFKEFFTDNGKMFSSALEPNRSLLSSSIREAPKYPFSQDKFITTNKIEIKIDLDVLTKYHKDLLLTNNVNKPATIKLYVKLLHDNNFDCSYFESSPFIYDFAKINKGKKYEFQMTPKYMEEQRAKFTFEKLWIKIGTKIESWFL